MEDLKTDNWFRSISEVHNSEELSVYLSELRKEGHTVTLSNYLNTIMHKKGLLLRNVVSESNLEQQTNNFSRKIFRLSSN